MHTTTTDIYTLSLHDALPISCSRTFTITAGRSAPSSTWPTIHDGRAGSRSCGVASRSCSRARSRPPPDGRSEEHTSELQSLRHLVCRLLLEKKKKRINTSYCI